MKIEFFLLIGTTLYQTIASWLEARMPPPGRIIDVDRYRYHLYVTGEGTPTIVVDSSLGGMEGYFLIEELSKLSRTCIYDRPGYGWSDIKFNSRDSQHIALELDALLSTANIEPPYLLVGNSFGSYNMRMYAHFFPEKVVGMVLTDGLHERGMLTMSLKLEVLKYFFASGFIMSVFGSLLGIIRLLKIIKIFELIKPQLRQCSPQSLFWVKRSFCFPKHWLTMAREILSLNRSGELVKAANNFGSLPIVNIKAESFFKPSIMTLFIPLRSANKLRDKMHEDLLQLSTNCRQIKAENSGHFVWLYRPDTVILAVQKILLEIKN
jgi:pimeloyl-ACP methyl ester carboxylesterase